LDSDGGGFGFTGRHKHKNWANDRRRKVLLTALVWLCTLDVRTWTSKRSSRPRRK
jgi:hypothetical protein